MAAKNDRRIKQAEADKLVQELPVSGFRNVQSIPTAYALPLTVDDAESQFGIDLYDRMAHHPIIQGCVNGLAGLVCESETKILPRYGRPIKKSSGEDKSDPDGSGKGLPTSQAQYDMSMEIVDFVNECLDAMATDGLSLQELQFQLVKTGISHGNKLAEVVYRVEDVGKYAGRYVVDSIMPKPRENFAWITDQAYRVIGVQAKIPGTGLAIRSGPISDLAGIPNTVSRDKLLWFTPFAENGDPRGHSLLRGAYLPWRKLVLGDPEDVKTAAQFGGGMLTLEGDKDAVEYIQQDGELKTVQEVAGPAMEAMKNSAWMITPKGWSLKRHNPATTDYFDGYTRRSTEQIVTAVVTAARAFLEARFGSRADSDTAFDLVACFVNHLRKVWEKALRERVVRQLVLVNYGPEIAQEYCPRVSAREGAGVEFASVARGARDLVEGGVITEQMRAQLVHEKFGWEFEPGKSALDHLIENGPMKDSKQGNTDKKPENK